MFDQIKEAMQSGKEQAIMNSVMAMFGSQIKAIKPENDIALFIEENMPALFLPEESHKGEYEAMSGMVAKLIVAEANENPEHSIKKLLAFYEAFRVWYKEYSKTSPVIP